MVHLAISAFFLLAFIYAIFIITIFQEIQVDRIYERHRPTNWAGYSFKPTSRIAAKCEFLHMGDILDYGFVNASITERPTEKRHFKLNLAEECNQTRGYPLEVTAIQLSRDPEVFVVDVKVAAIERFSEKNISTEKSNIPTGLDVYWLLYVIPHPQLWCRYCRGYISTEVNASSALTSYIISLGFLRQYFPRFIDPRKVGTIKKENKDTHEVMALRRRSTETDTVTFGTPIRFLPRRIQHLIVGAVEDPSGSVNSEEMDLDNVWPLVHYAICVRKIEKTYVSMINCFPYISMRRDGLQHDTNGDCVCWGYIRIRLLLVHWLLMAWATALIFCIVLHTMRRRLKVVEVTPPDIPKEQCKGTLKIFVRVWLPSHQGSKISGALTIKCLSKTQNEIIKVTIDHKNRFSRKYLSSNEVSETAVKVYNFEEFLHTIHQIELTYESDSSPILYLFGIACATNNKQRSIFPYGNYLESQRQIKLSELAVWLRLRRLMASDDNFLRGRVESMTNSVTLIEVMYYILHSFIVVPGTTFVQVNANINPIVGVLIVEFVLLCRWLAFYFAYWCYIRPRYLCKHLIFQPTIVATQACELVVNIAWLHVLLGSFLILYGRTDTSWSGLPWGDTLSFATAQTFEKKMQDNDIKWIYLCAISLGVHYTFVLLFCVVLRLRRKERKATPGPMLSLEEDTYARDYLDPT